MITRLQNFFLKHNKWLFGSLLVVIIVTFVLTIGPQSFFGGPSGPQREAIEYYGYDLSSEADQRALAQSAEVSAILHPELRLRRQQMMDYAYLRVTALGIANQLGIPQPTEKQLQNYIETISLFQDRQTGEFSAETYNSILQALQSNARFSRPLLARVLREDFRIREVRRAMAGPDYTLPFATRQDYLNRRTSYRMALAHLDYASFSPELEPAEEDLRSFYKENPGRYEIPERIQVTALFFREQAYRDEVDEPTEEQLRTLFNQRKTQYEEEFGPGESTSENEASAEDSDSAASDEPAITFGEIRDEVRQDYIIDEAIAIAARKAENFSVQLWQQKLPYDSDAYHDLLESFEVRSRSLEPYARGQAPSLEDVPAELLESMWIYLTNPQRYFSDIATIDDGAVVLVTQGSLPSRMPPFEEVKAAVTTQYKTAEKRRLFAERGKEIREQLSTAVSREDKPFIEAATELGLQVEELDTFTGASIPREIRSAGIWEQARFLEEGEISPMSLQENRGTFAYMKQRSVPSVDFSSEEFTTYAQRRQNAMGDTLGWVRLREITDQNLGSLLGGPVEMP